VSTHHDGAGVGRNKPIPVQSGEVDTGNTSKICLRLQLVNGIYKMRDRSISNWLSVSFEYTKSFLVAINGKLNRLV